MGTEERETRAEYTPQREQHLHPAFMHNQYEVRRKFLKFPETFDILDKDGNFIMKAKEKAFQYSFDLYEDKEKQKKLLNFHVRPAFKFQYDIEDPETGELVGRIKNDQLKSIIREHWTFLSPEGKPIGTLERRKLTKALALHEPKTFFNPLYEIQTPEGKEVADMQRKPSWGDYIFDVRIKEKQPELDRRLILASSIILMEELLQLDAVATNTS